MVTAFILAALNVFGTYDIPPKRFDHAPNTPVMVLEYDLDRVQRVCDHRSANFWSGDNYTLGCSFTLSSQHGLGDVTKDMRPSDKNSVLWAAWFSQWLGNICVVVLPYRNELSQTAYNHDRRHELAHCNGWKHPETD